MIQHTNTSRRLDLTFAALSDPTRRAILARLARGEKTVSELAAPFNVTMPAITKHLKVMERAGLVERGQTAQWRPCRLKPKPLGEAVDWIDRYREIWETNFARLDTLLEELQAPAQNAAARSRKKAKGKVRKKQKGGGS
ncbi:MAG: winged helix-turn-helix transcriptional regulator [Candidatus Eisenbacteria bacterium]|uniref:Winged helix-turn-helix transcriptional regulator n=1 Tax=Eiseniibacteriota bacterium TaxID=2212470 RepID=A0A7Y2E8C2_UNCEI|nr:winged helix-turn-helix transcriptional regulator [Candidatus Eisenbacteria bacterium]